MSNLKRWCVQSREGWCGVHRNRKPADGAFSVDTVCGYSISLPWGVEQRVPTCPDCLRILLPRTDWAKQFRKAASLYTYKEALSRAGQPVEVLFSDETGEDLWAVSCEDSFWMDALPTEQEALQLVEEMGWPML